MNAQQDVAPAREPRPQLRSFTSIVGVIAGLATVADWATNWEMADRIGLFAVGAFFALVVASIHLDGRP